MSIVEGYGLRFAAPLLISGLVACSSQASKHPPDLPDFGLDAAADTGSPMMTMDASTVDAGPPGCASSDMMCNQLQNCAPKTFVQDLAMAPPSPVGGTLVEGNYVLTDFTVYTEPGGMMGMTGAWFIETLQLSGGNFSDVSETDVTMGSQTFSGTYMLIPPNALSLSYNCQSNTSMTSGQRSVYYSQNPGQLILDIPPFVTGNFFARATYTQM